MSKQKWMICLAFFASGLGLFRAALASDFQSARTCALGGAGHAQPVLTDALTQAPSALSTMPFLGMSISSTLETPHLWNLSLLEGQRDFQNLTGVAFGASLTQSNPASLFHIGIARQLADTLSIGVGTKVIWPKDRSSNPAVDGNLSLSWILSNDFRFSLILDNLWETLPSAGYLRELTFGTKWSLPISLHLYFDPLWLLNPPDGQPNLGFEGGLEYSGIDHLFLRLGTFHNAKWYVDGSRTQGWSWGLGLLLPSIWVDYASRTQWNSSSNWIHQISVGIYY